MNRFLKTADIPTHGARTLAGRYYTAPEVFARERERIFARRWLCVGRAEDVARPGEMTAHAAAGESVLLVRGRDGALRGFYNVCRHRGTRLCEAERKPVSETIQCPYHAWTYGLDGQLLGAPHMQGVPGFDRRDYPLHAVAVAEWEGFVFLNLADAPEPLGQVYAPLAERVAPWNLGALRAQRRIDYDVRANWKLLFQNYSECYHCPMAHPALAQRSPYLSGQNDLVDGPFLGGPMALDDEYASLTMTGATCALPPGDLAGEDRRRVYYYTVFPNLFLSLHPDYVMAHVLSPEAPDRTRITCVWLFHPEAPDRPGFNPDDAVAFWDMTNRQDWRLCELSQEGVASRAYVPGPYSAQESLLAAFDREVLKTLGEE